VAFIDFNDAKVTPLESIAELKALVDIVDVAGDYTTLKKRKVGLYRGCCPLHNESTGSFDVDQYKQQFHCYGCGAHGDVLDLIAGVERLDKVGAIKSLRKLVGRDGTSSKPVTKPQRAATLAAPPTPAARFQDSAERSWCDCQPIAPGTPAAAYLAARGCRLPHEDGDLRWYDGLRHPYGYVGPALVGLVTDTITGEPMTLHRT